MRKRQIIRWSLVLLLVVLAVGMVWARAGGGGGGGDSYSGGGGSSGDDGDVAFLIWILLEIFLFLYSLPPPFDAISIGGLTLLIVVVAITRTRAKRRQSIYDQMPDERPVSKVRGYNKFITANPGFDKEEFFKKVRKAFFEIQESWQKQDLSNVRRFISDGVWQRFESQFVMMRRLKQKNTINKLEIRNVVLDRIDVDGSYDIAHVAIHATIVDRFVSEIDSSLNSGGKEEFVEYWSFIKKRGIVPKDMYDKPACPNCGGDLSASDGETTKCPYCGSLTNSGAFDWVLSEITQAEDYIGTRQRVKIAENLSDKLAELVGESDDFSAQLIEDKASNGYLQLLIGRSLRDPALFRRFVSDELFEKEKAGFDRRNIVYNRLYLRDVSLLSARQEDDRNILAIALRSSFQRVILHEGVKPRVEKLDQGVFSRTEVIFMERDAGVALAKGSLYAHNCPNCGGPLENALEVKCPWCGAILNSTSREWIITQVMGVREYQRYEREHRSDFKLRVSADLLDKAFHVRDFAFNNILVMIAADGVIDEEEVAFVYAVAKKYGYNKEMVAAMIKQAPQLSIRMPEGLKDREKVFVLMEKAAYADGWIAEAEQALLESVANEYLKPLREQDASG